MSRVQFGEATALVVEEIIHDNPLRTPADLAILANERLEDLDMRARLNSTTINSFLSFHPKGIALRDKVAIQENKRRPAWANDHTIVATGTLRKKGQLVVYQSVGIPAVDAQFVGATAAMRRIAKAAPASRQDDVVKLQDTLNFAAHTIKILESTMEVVKSMGGPVRPRMIED